MSKFLTISLFMATLGATAACGQRHYYRGGYADFGYSQGGPSGWGSAYGGYVRHAPPPVRYERWGRAPGPGYVWCDGYWDWRGNRWSWMGGTWCRPPRHGSAWAGGGWRSYGNRGYRWHPGRWR